MSVRKELREQLSQKEEFFHGTTRQNVKNILKDGVDVLHERRSDVGDFGFGFYMTKSLSRAQNAGKVLVLNVDTSNMAFVENPYLDKDFQPSTKPEEILYDIIWDNGKAEVHQIVGPGINRQEARERSIKIRARFMRENYTGIKSGLYDEETVAFVGQAILDVNKL